MLKQLNMLKKEYNSRKAHRGDTVTRFEDKELINWIASSMQLAGYSLTRKDVGKVISGEGTGGGTIEEYLLIQRYMELISKFRYMLEMSIEIDERYLNEIYMMLSSTTSTNFRKKHESLFGYAYYPPYIVEIKGKMAELMRLLGDVSLNSEPVIKAVFLHNKIFEIQPFEDKNDAVAYAALCYELVRNGFPLLALDISREEYLEYMKDCLVGGKVTGLLTAVAKALATEMNVIIKG